MKAYNQKRILVTGGAGFIGSHLVDALLKTEAESVAVVDNLFLGKKENLLDAQKHHGKRLKIYYDDAANFDTMRAIMEAEKPDIVFNLATKALLYSFFNPSGAYRVNVDIILALAELQRQGTFDRLVHISTSEVYGTAKYVPMDETHPMLPETSYAAGKAAADLLLLSYINMFKLNAIIVRPFNNYGPRQNAGELAAIIPLTIMRIKNGEQPIIQGDGLQTRDFIYVGDTVNGMMKLAMMQVKGDVYNLGSGYETSIKQIVEEIIHIMDYKKDIVYTESRPADVLRHVANIKKINAVFNDFNVQPTTLKDGLMKTVEWYIQSENKIYQ